jgi:uncharacterized ferritin-like protein (DUF455 family)
MYNTPMDFYKELETALVSKNINTKELIINSAIEYCYNNTPKNLSAPKHFSKPSYAQICKIVAPKELPKRRDLSSKEGLEALLHSITHIEFSAIDLAIDAAYRFRDLDNQFRLDWLIVAQDEVRHFKMLHKLLEQIDSFYGALPVHSSLFEMAVKTEDNLLDRMAIIPRYFEASGLDVNPKIIQKLKNYKQTDIIKETILALEVIYKEEIDHVRKGDKWFKHLCNSNNLDANATYKAIIEKFNLKSRASQYNVEARKEAGFSCEELLDLGVKKCE